MSDSLAVHAVRAGFVVMTQWGSEKVLDRESFRETIDEARDYAETWHKEHGYAICPANILVRAAIEIAAPEGDKPEECQDALSEMRACANRKGKQ